MHALPATMPSRLFNLFQMHRSLNALYAKVKFERCIQPLALSLRVLVFIRLIQLQNQHQLLNKFNRDEAAYRL
jgi:hypothetical protein